MRFYLIVGIMLAAAQTSFSQMTQEEAETRAKASIAIAQAKAKQPEPSGSVEIMKSGVSPRLFVDYSKARAAALFSGRPLLVWVACDPGERFSELAEFTQVTAPSYGGDPSPRLIVGEPREGDLWELAQVDDTRATAKLIRAILRPEKIPVQPRERKVTNEPKPAAQSATINGADLQIECASGNCGSPQQNGGYVYPRRVGGFVR